MRNDSGEMSLIFITHDLGVIAEIADSCGGDVRRENSSNTGSVWQIFSNPQHPYTKGLLACRPQLGPAPAISADGCRFYGGGD